MTNWVYDTRAIMKEAHQAARKMVKFNGTYAEKLKMGLRVAWGGYKDAMKAAKENESKSQSVSRAPRATPKQISYLSKLAQRISNVRMFDSSSESGHSISREIQSMIHNGLTKQQASNLISRSLMMLDDAM